MDSGSFYDPDQETFAYNRYPPPPPPTRPATNPPRLSNPGYSPWESYEASQPVAPAIAYPPPPPPPPPGPPTQQQPAQPLHTRASWQRSLRYQTPPTPPPRNNGTVSPMTPSLRNQKFEPLTIVDEYTVTPPTTSGNRYSVYGNNSTTLSHSTSTAYKPHETTLEPDPAIPGGWVKRSLTGRFPSLRRKGTGGRYREVTNDTVEDGGFEGVDLSSFDTAIPEKAIKKMEELDRDANFAYTADGEAVDLSALSGFGNEADTDADTASLIGGKRKNNESSFYFPEDPLKPNWKPHVMRKPYLIFLVMCSVAGIAVIEFLCQFAKTKAHTRERADGNKTIPNIPHLMQFMDVATIDIAKFATWKYLPTAIAVIYGILWEQADSEIKRLEPYYHLSQRPKGALAESSLNVEYLTFWTLLVPFQAIRHRHIAVVLSSISSILAAMVLPALQTAAIELQPKLRDRKTKTLDENKVMKSITMHPVFSRLLEGVLGYIAINAIALIIIFHRRSSGLLGDPRGIAGVAAMANQSHILHDFDGLDLATEEEIHKQLSKRTYILHKAALWQGEFVSESRGKSIQPKAQNPHPLMLRLKGGIPFIVYCAFLIIFLPLVNENKNLGMALETVPWMTTLLATIAKSIWTIVDRDLRILEPFYQLHLRHAPYTVLTTDLTSVVPGIFIFSCIHNKRYLLAYVSVITFLSEILTVCVGSIYAKGGEESPKSSKVSLALSIIILFFTGSGMALVLRYRRQAFLPRQPATISSVLAFIYQAKMLTDFSGTEQMNTNQRKAYLKRKAEGKTYGFGWYRGRDGKQHVGIDEEDLLRPYTGGEGERFLDGGMTAGPEEGNPFGE